MAALLSRCFLLFMVYSILGWIAETIYCSVGQRKYVQRGFLYGPLCPIYGFGATFVIFLLKPFRGNILLVFLLGVIITSALEYLTSFLMEKLFHMRWWDYSKRFLNINGRVCLLNSCLFGVLTVFVTEFLHPHIWSLLCKIPAVVAYLSASLLFIVLAIDTFISIKSVLNLSQRLEKISQLQKELKQKLQQQGEQLKERLELLKSQHPKSEIRILKSFPNLTSLKHVDILNELKEQIKQKTKRK